MLEDGLGLFIDSSSSTQELRDLFEHDIYHFKAKFGIQLIRLLVIVAKQDSGVASARSKIDLEEVLRCVWLLRGVLEEDLDLFALLNIYYKNRKISTVPGHYFYHGLI